MRQLFKMLISRFYTFLCLRNVQHGIKCKCNFYCKFTQNTQIGSNCHFNGMKISGCGKVKIGSNFHSGKNIRIITTFHNWKTGTALPYDNTYYSKDISIGDNVWLGEDIIILGGVSIGEGAIIQAGSVVCKNIPDMAVAGGHPASVFKYRDKKHYEKLKNEGSFL